METAVEKATLHVRESGIGEGEMDHNTALVLAGFGWLLGNINRPANNPGGWRGIVKHQGAPAATGGGVVAILDVLARMLGVL